MGFFNTLEKIQKKPEAARKKILFMTVTLIMIIVIFVWLSGLKYSLTDTNEEKDQTPGPFTIFKTSVLEGVANLKSAIR